MNKFSAQLDGYSALRIVERNGSAPNAPADATARLHDGDALPGFCENASRLESRNARTDDQHIVSSGHHEIVRTVALAGICDAIIGLRPILAVNQSPPEAFFEGIWGFLTDLKEMS